MAKTRLFLVFVSFLAVSGLALAQEQPDQGSTPAPPSSQPQPEETQQRMPEMERPVYLSGKVIYDDGSPADTSVLVEMVCNGRTRRQIHTFSGVFTMEISNTNQRVTVMDASASSRDLFGGINSESEDALARMVEAGGQSSSSLRSANPGYRNLMGCELRANQPGFQSDIIPLSIVRPLDNPDVGVIVLHRAGAITGTTTSVVSMAAPKQAKKAYRRAVKEVKKDKGSPEKAVVELEKATEIYPEYAEAWELLGQIRLEQHDEPGARQAFESAVAGDPEYMQPSLALMQLGVRNENWEEVSKWSSKVAELNPYIVLVDYYQGVASINLNQMEQAQQSFQRVRNNYKGDDYPYASYMLGYILANQGEFESAAAQLRDFLKIKSEAAEADQIKAHLAQWEKEGHLKSDKN